MSKSMPSLLALLGLVAFAGYQNRGKISEMLNDARQGQPGARPGSPPNASGDGGGLLSQLGQMFQSGTVGTTLSGGLGELVNRFKAAGQGPTANSWVADGPNVPVQHHDLESALGDDTLAELGQKTGLSRAELVRRLSAALPDVVNRLTPDGRVPTQTEAQALV